MKEKCEICGVALTDANRSKSYRNRCKACVAKLMAQKREAVARQSTKTVARQRTEQIIQLSETDREIEADVVRFIRHEAMRAGVQQERVKAVIKKMQL